MRDQVVSNILFSLKILPPPYPLVIFHYSLYASRPCQD